MATCNLHIPGENHLLSLLPEDDRRRVLDAMERVETRHGETLFRQHEPIAAVDFPLQGVLSVVVVMEDGGVAEVGTVGNEGMAGVPLAMGTEHSPAQAFYQVPGSAYRMPAQAFRAEIEKGGAFAALMRLYAQAFLSQVSQSAACNRLHSVQQRLCRWILMSHDRAGGDRIALTQEFLAQMLGVRRATVSVAAGELQKAGLIRYNRGVINVLDRERLEQSSCECYAVVRREFERLLC
ncbi:MAG TPA: Crp/Fnr family transcriptional regulator [Burkholderiales bacterium]|nr:Crp/Fnr family transcriptional regulator [Burkholderiales bacterium]